MANTDEKVLLFIIKDGKMLSCHEYADVSEKKSMILLKYQVNLNDVDPKD
jgi:hypothetical protein